MAYLWLAQAIMVLLYVFALPAMAMWLLFMPLILIFAIGLMRLLVIVALVIAAVVASSLSKRSI